MFGKHRTRIRQRLALRLKGGKPFSTSASAAYSRALRFEPLENRLLLASDFGDAPAPYATLLANNGARHEAIGPNLGALRDTELDGLPSTLANGDDTDPAGANDEDGVLFSTIRVGQLGATATVNVQNAPASARLDAWVDFNRDGNWGGGWEHIADNVLVQNGDNTITFNLPYDATPGLTFARFRLSTAGNLSPKGAAADGEVEDYSISVLPAVVSSGQFGLSTSVGTTLPNREFFPVDLDRDGYMDVVSASYQAFAQPSHGNIIWHRNQGDGTFTQQILSDFAPFDSTTPTAIMALDADGDGDIDIIHSSYRSIAPDLVRLYTNNGSQQFSTITSVEITSDTSGASFPFIGAADMDGDGDIDLLSSAHTSDSLNWYEYTAPRTYTKRLVASFSGAEEFYPADFDRDGDMDVVARGTLGSADGIVWCENTGSQVFALHWFTTTLPSIRCIQVADMNGDGFIDIIAASDAGAIAWYQNFTGPAPVEHVLANIKQSVSTVIPGDLNGDGLMDLVVGTSSTTRGVSILLNNGTSQFSEQTILSPTLTNLTAYPADFDGDGDLDILTEEGFLWFENADSQVSVAAAPTQISESGTTTTTFTFTRNGRITDSLTAAFGVTGTAEYGVDFEQSGAASFSLTSGSVTFQPGAATATIQITALANATIEPDETIALLVKVGSNYVAGSVPSATVTIGEDRPIDFGDAGGPYPTLFANNGPRHAPVGPQLGATRDAEADANVATAGTGDDLTGGDDEDGVTFVPLQVGQLNASALVNVQNAASGARLDAWFDFNGNGSWGDPGEQIAKNLLVHDGDNLLEFDVPTNARLGLASARFRLSTAGSLTTVGWAADGEVEDYRVEIAPPRIAAGEFVAASQVAASISSVDRLYVYDFDNDGDNDILSTSVSSDRIYWMENNGTATFTARQLAVVSGGIANVVFADMDGDGDLDAVVNTEASGVMLWFEHTATHTYTQRTLISQSAQRFTLEVADADGDGDLDVFAHASNSTTYWYENNGQLVFTTHTLATSVVVVWLEAVDWDQDGDMDLVSAWSKGATNNLGWWENDGLQNYFSHQLVAIPNLQGRWALADIEGDGDFDFVAAAYTPAVGGYTLQWYKNNGDFTFTSSTLATSSNAFDDFCVADLEGDGDLDVSYVSTAGKTLAWYRYDGGAQPFTLKSVQTNLVAPKAITVGDIDRDGDFDLVSSDFSEAKLYWRAQVDQLVGVSVSPNISLEDSGVASVFQFVRTGYIANPLTVSFAVAGTAAFNADYSQSGAATFTSTTGTITFAAGAETAELTITPQADEPYEGNETVIITVTSATAYLANALSPTATTIIIEDGTLDFGDAPDTYRTTLAQSGARHGNSGPQLGVSRDSETDGQPSAGAVADDAGADDEDGVIFGTIRAGAAQATVTVNVQNVPTGARLDAWFDWNGDGTWSGAGEHIIKNLAVVAGNNVLTVQLPPDVQPISTYARFRLSTAGNLLPTGLAADGEVEDYQVTISPPTPSSGQFAPPTLLKSGATATDSITSIDLDKDGDVDLLASYSNTVAWYENNGSGSFTERVLSTTTTSARSLQPVDLDGDGDLDVLVASPGSSSIYGFINNGTQTFTRTTFATSSTGASGVQALVPIDMDGDGDMDFVSTTTSSLNWYEQTGNLVFTRRQINSASNAYVVAAADLDRDGDIDIVATRPTNYGPAWYENTGGQVFTAHTFSFPTFPSLLAAAQIVDLNGDGDLDIFYSMVGASALYWAENNGDRTFTVRNLYVPVYVGDQASAADLDGDGDVDILVVHKSNENAVAWYENSGVGTFTLHVIATQSVPGPAFEWASAADVDGDGDLDLQIANTTSISLYKNLNVAPAVGDYDHDGVVGDSDYAMWRSSFGSTFDLRPDGNANNAVDAADYVLWRKNKPEAAAGSALPAAGAAVNLASPPAEANVGAASAIVEPASAATAVVPAALLSSASSASAPRGQSASRPVVAKFANLLRTHTHDDALLSVAMPLHRSAAIEPAAVRREALSSHAVDLALRDLSLPRWTTEFPK